MSVSVDTGGGSGGRKNVDVNINLVPFIDMMSCLVAFLLITAVWTNVAQIPSSVGGSSQNPNAPQSENEDRPPDISVLLDADSIWVGYGTFRDGALDQRQIKKKDDGYDFEALGAVLTEYKKTNDFANRNDIQIGAEEQV